MGKVKGLTSCYVCGKKHDKGKVYRFPDDMPLKFRWCCNCLSYANIIIKGRCGIETLIKMFKQQYSRIQRTIFIRRAKKVYKLVQVN